MKYKNVRDIIVETFDVLDVDKKNDLVELMNVYRPNPRERYQDDTEFIKELLDMKVKITNKDVIKSLELLNGAIYANELLVVEKLKDGINE